MYLTKSECNKLCTAGSKLKRIAQDAADVLNESCEGGRPMAMIQDYERCSQKWVTAFAWMGIVCELTRTRAEDHLDGWLRILDKSIESETDTMAITDHIAFDVLPIAKTMPKAIQLMCDWLKEQLGWETADDVSTKRKRLLMRRIKTMRTELLEYTVSEHKYQWMQIPAYAPPFPLLLDAEQNLFTGWDGSELDPVAKCIAIQARLWLYYRQLIIVLQTLMDQRQPLELLQAHCNMNSEFLTTLLNKELAHGDDDSTDESTGAEATGGRRSDDNAAECEVAGARTGRADRAHGQSREAG